MTDESRLSFPIPRPEAMPEALMENAQHQLACWSRACMQATHGWMAAGMAQMDLARRIYAVHPQDWPLPPSDPVAAREAARHWLRTAQASLDHNMRAYRKINDDLVASLFAALESLTDGRASAVGEPGNDNRARLSLPAAAGPEAARTRRQQR